MKKLIWMGLILILRTSYGQSTAPAPQVLAGPFEWTGEAHSLGGINGQTVSAFVNEVHCLSLQTEAKTPAVYTLRTLGPAIVSLVTAKHYAVVGHIQYSDVAPGTFLELENWFVPEQPGGPEAFYYSRTLAEAGPMAKLEGSDDGHDFALPFDATGTKTRLSRLVLKLHIMGPGQIQISNVKLVQYSDAAAGSSPPATGLPEAMRTIRVSMQDGIAHYSLPGWDNAPLSGIEEAIRSDRNGTNPQPYFIQADRNVPFQTIENLQTTLRRYGEIQLRSGPDNAASSDEIALHVARAGDGSSYVTIGQVVFDSFSALMSSIQNHLKADPHAKFIVRADRDVSYQDIQAIMGLFDPRNGGNGNVSLIVDPDRVSEFAPLGARASVQVAPVPAAQASTGTLDGRSFGVGVLATLATICGFALLLKLGRRFRGLRHARELRRIASLDG